MKTGLEKMALDDKPMEKDGQSKKKELTPPQGKTSKALERGRHQLKRHGKKLSKPLVPYYKNVKTLMTHEYTILSALAAIIGIISALATWGFRKMIIISLFLLKL